MTDKPAEAPTLENPLVVSIEDVQMKNQIITYTITINTIVAEFKNKKTSVERSHDQFNWLYREISKNPKYEACIIPRLPPKPDFVVDRDALSCYVEDEDPKSEEYIRMKSELEREFMAIFKKTLATHEKFLIKLARIPLMRNDANLIEFLSSPTAISTTSNTGTFLTEKLGDAKRAVSDNITISFSGITEKDSFFDNENRNTTEYMKSLNQVINTADNMINQEKKLTNNHIKLFLQFAQAATIESVAMSKIYEDLSGYFDDIRKCEARQVSDEDLELVDTLKMDFLASESKRDLLIRRIKKQIEAENELKNLNKARQSNLNVATCEDKFTKANENFENISNLAKEEIERESRDRIIYFQNRFTNLCNLQINQLKAQIAKTNAIILKLEAEG